MAKCHGQAATVDYFELRFLHGCATSLKPLFRPNGPTCQQNWQLRVRSSHAGLASWAKRRACEYFVRKAEQVAVALADPAIHAHVCNLDALWRIGHCHWTIVDRRLGQAQELSLRAGDQLRWSNAQVIRFWSLFYRGDWGALEQTAHELLSRAQNSGNAQQEIWALRCKSLCALHADRPREATEYSVSSVRQCVAPPTSRPKFLRRVRSRLRLPVPGSMTKVFRSSMIRCDCYATRGAQLPTARWLEYLGCARSFSGVVRPASRENTINGGSGNTRLFTNSNVTAKSFQSAGLNTACGLA